QERSAFAQGLKIWKGYYAKKLYVSLVKDDSVLSPKVPELMLLLTCAPEKLIRLFAKKAKQTLVRRLKNNLPDKVLKSLFASGLARNYTPKPGKVNAGDFQRVTPFSFDFGFDRGGPVDRFYIENFLEANREHVTGSVLEIGDNAYTMRFGGDRVKRSDILHVDSRNEKATYIGDITHVPEIPSGFFDCIIFTQTLHLIYDFKSAVQTCHRILKPGGCLLLTVPGISQVDYGEWKDYWLWSFTDTSIRRLLSESFQEKNVHVKSYGNVYVATAFLYGMGLPEVKKDFLFYHDPAYQVLISARAVKL
ncbi:MAG TPA: methyltransferase domain-containing protein, partial [Chryseosolibacter sp.]|nr:methyltransferase domain-containing protein [Chryseosolibacter sp.]